MKPEDLPPELTDRTFEIVVRRLADDLQYGLDASRYLGAGVDYVQSRPFVDGDAVRDLDWRVTGRTGRYHVKQYESLKRMVAYLVVDTSASMAFSSRRLSKQELATILAGALSLAAIRRFNPVGVVDAGSRDLHVEPSLSRAIVFQWLQTLRHVAYHEQTRLAARLEELVTFLNTRSLIIVLSDLHDPSALSAIRRTSQRHDVIVIELEDPAERGGLRAGLLPAVEAETGRMFVARGRTRWFGGDDAALAASLKESAIDHLVLSTDQDIVVPLRRFLRDRGGLFRNTR